jgi:hypothetical protein
MKWVTLFHEVIHCIEAQHRDPVDEDQFTEEEMTWLSNSFYLCLKENNLGVTIECNLDLDSEDIFENGFESGTMNGSESPN